MTSNVELQEPLYQPGSISIDRWDEMPEEYRGMLRYLVRRQLEGEIAACETFSQAVQYLDRPEHKIELCKTAAEESTHIGIISDLAQKIGIDMDDLLAKRRPLASWFLGEVDDVRDWTEVCVFKWLVDRAGNIWLWSMRNTSFQPYAETMPPILRDEARHQADGAKTVLGEIENGRRELVQKYLDKWFPRGMQLLGRPQSKGNILAHKYGLKHADSAVEMRKYIREIMPTVEKGGLTLPSPEEIKARGVEILDVTW